MASRRSSCRTPDWNRERRARTSVRAACASSAVCSTRSPTKCVDALCSSVCFCRSLFTYSYLISLQWDERSTGPPPPPAILVTGLNPLTPYPLVRRHFAQHGTIVACDGKSDKYTGAPLGIVWVNYANHELAKHVVARENGQRVWLGGEGQLIHVELDSAQQEKCKQRVNAEIARRRKEHDAKAMRPPPNPPPLAGTSSSSSASSASSAAPGALPQGAGDAGTSTAATPLNSSALQQQKSSSSGANAAAPGPANAVLPPKPTAAFPAAAAVNGPSRTVSASRMSTEAPNRRRRAHSPGRSRSPSRSRSRTPTRSPRRPPSPGEPPPPPPQRTIPKPKTPADLEREREEEHEEILKVLEASGKEHIKIDGLPLGRGVLDRSGMIGLKEADVKEFFDGFEPDQVRPSPLPFRAGTHTN
jgi:hypothetical protein